MHYIYSVIEPNTSGLYLASVDGPPTLLGKGEVIQWLDASRYIYFTSNHGDAPTYVLGEIGKEQIPILSGNIWPLRWYGSIVFDYQP